MLVETYVHNQLMSNGIPILFQHWKSAYEWDQENHTMKCHEKLTHHHFDLDGWSKMRNALAEDLLDDTMYYLMVVSYERSYYTQLWFYRIWVPWPKISKVL